jgi:hypothetical protein
MKIQSSLKLSRHLTVLLLAAASGALLAPSSTLAQPANWLQYQLGASASGGPSSPSYNSGPVPGTNLLTASISIDPQAQDDVYANARITYGGLQLNAGSAVNNSPSTGDGYLTSFGPSVGGGWDIAFQDSLTITSATLPYHAAVQVQVATVYAGATSPGISINSFDGASDGASVAIQVLAAENNTVTGAVDGKLQTNTITQVFSTRIGDTAIIIPSITITGGVYDGDGLPMSFSVAASVVSQTYVDVLTPGASYTSASGTVYPTLLSAAPPPLGIQPAANGVTLFWPVTTATYRLEQNSDLTTANWIASTNPVNAVSGTNQVTVSPAAGNLFFRLINP